ncbi:MAG: pilus assembly protein PilM [Minisyncoccota bacterium]
MSLVFNERLRALFAPPRYMAFPLSGVDLSTSGVKAVRLTESTHGLVLSNYVEVRLPAGAFTDGEIVDRAAVIEALASAAKATGITAATVSLPESKSYLFETTVSDATKAEQRIAIEQRLDEFIPLPPSETVFDFLEVGRNEKNELLVAGIGFARRIVEETLSTFDQAAINVRTLEGETFASSRAILLPGDDATVLIIDVGKTTTKLSIVTRRVPRFATTINIGGHALTLAVQKYFGVTEEEARKVKSERGIVPTPGNEEYLAAMLSTVSAIRDEISRHLTYWQERVARGGLHEAVSRAIIIGGNASVRGLPEYLEGSLQIPVTAGDVFTNLASRDTWVPALDYTESLAYATAIGLALRDHVTAYG